MSKIAQEPIAIVGTACRFPGNVANIEEYWSFLKAGGDAVGEIPASRWSWQFHYDKNPEKAGKSYVKRGSFMNIDVEAFDAAFFDISPREAALLDPQQRLLLELTFEALEDAVGDVNTLQGSQTGVYIGCFMQDNLLTQMSPGAKSSAGTYTAVSSTMTMISNRLSYAFDLKGPSFTMDTACSSSLVAVHQACLGLRARDCNMAIAGGVSVMFRPEVMMMMCKGHFLAADGRSKTFSANADGYGRGEGGGLVVLKRLADAIADGDTIHGIIMSSGVNQDGSTEGITVPSETAQIALASKVYRDGLIDPKDITYLEAHGTGTPVGDPIEMRAMGTVIGNSRTVEDDPLIVGSVKAGIGHLEAAAGIAGLLKAMLVAKHGHIPPQAWLDTELNPAIDFKGLNIKIADQYQPLPKSKVNGLSYIAVNSFGYGGTNAHAVVSAPDANLHKRSNNINPLLLPSRYHLLISGASESACEAYAQIYSDLIANASDSEVLNLCRNIAKKTPLAFRWLIAADSAAELKQKLTEALTGTRMPGLFKGRMTSPQNPVFVFSGMGPQWWAMGQQLYREEPVYALAVEEADAIFKQLSGWSILAEMLKDESESKVAETAIAQAGNFIVQLGVIQLLASWGIKPSAVVGHSVGEVSSAYASGMLSLRDALTVSYHRGRTQAKTAGTGAMLATALSLEDAEKAIAPYNGKVSIAGINSPSNSTLSGDEDCIDALAAQLESEGVFARKLRVEVPYHSAGMDPILDELNDSLKSLKPLPSKVKVYSTVTGKLALNNAFNAQYWCDNVRQPVYFNAAMDSLIADGYETFLEIGPHPVLTGYIKEIMGVHGTKGNCFNTLKRKEDEVLQLRDAVAALWVNGVNWDVSTWLGEASQKVKLPAYPWQRKSFWHEDKYARLIRQGWPNAQVLLGYKTADPIPTWHSELSLPVVSWLEDHKVGQKVVFPGAGYVDILLAVLEQQNQGVTEKVLRNIHFHRTLMVDDNECTIVKTILDNANKIYIYAGIAARNDEWSLHGSAELIQGRYTAPSHNPLETLDLSTFENVDVTQLYQTLGNLGLDYGPSFQSIKVLKKQGSKAFIDLSTLSSTEHFVHPGLLDGAFQAMLALNESSVAYLPVGIKEMRFHAPVPSDCQALLEITQWTARSIQANVTLILNGQVCCEIMGIRCDAVQLVGDNLQKNLDETNYRLQWQEIGFNDKQIAHTEIALVGNNIPPEVKDGLLVYGTEKISEYVNLGALIASETVTQCSLIALFVNSSSAQGALEDSIAAVQGLQALVKLGYQSSVIFVTEQAMAQGVRHSQKGWMSAWCIGLRRNASNELGEINLRNLDVGSIQEDAYLLAAELCADSAPDEVAIVGRSRYAAQVLRIESNDFNDLAMKMSESYNDKRRNNFGLSVPARPAIQNLMFTKCKRVLPKAHEIEVRVDSVSLNYKDLAKVMGMLTEDMMANVNSGMTLGLECAGEVVAVGADVRDFKVGDLVVAGKTDCFSRYVILNTDRERLPVNPIYPLPANFNTAEASALFVAYTTAIWGLRDLAHLQAGETVLIHGAAGGVGVAAVNFAKKLGAKVIATAGSDEKRAFLLSIGADHVVNSRTLNFGGEVLAITEGKGVEVVFNSVGGGVVPVSFDVVADMGRFVEIGKAEVYSGGHLDMRPFDRGISYLTLDLDFLVTRNKSKYFGLIDDVWQLANAGDLKPLPVSVFGADKIGDAFAYLSRSKQIGKVVVDLNQAPVVSMIEPRIKPLSSNKTALITGGLGGVGLMYAHWLVDNGVKHLALLGRKGANTPEAEAAVSELKAKGVSVDVYACDVSDQQDLAEVITEIQYQHKLGAVIHAAGVLDDKSLLDMDAAAINKVAAPKILGAYNLHLLTQVIPDIELFVVISSVSAVTGNTYQANYCLANTFMDGLMEYRASIGLPANSLQLGAVAQVGMAQSNNDLERYLKTKGVNTFDPAMMQAIFSRVYEWNLPTLSPMDVDWPIWEYAETGAASSYRFQDVISKYGNGSSDSSIVSTLLAMPKTEQIETVGYIVAEHIANILQMNPDEVDLEAPLDSFGIDSITAVELQTIINRSLQVEMSILSLLSGKSLLGIAADIVGLMLQVKNIADASKADSKPTLTNINTSEAVNA